MAGKIVDLIGPFAAWWLRSPRMSFGCWRGAASKKAWQLRQGRMKAQMVAAQAVNWRDAPREAATATPWRCSMENDMAKGQLRSNREKKKPKADKNKTKSSTPASPWASTQFQPKSTRRSTGNKTS